MRQELDVSGCFLVSLAAVRDPRGNLTFVESARTVLFEIKRVYYLYDVPAGETRAGHAHRELEQMLVAISGSFDVILDDGRSRETVTLNRPFIGLHVPQLVWREIENFSSAAVCLVFASDYFAESDYIRDYDTFLKIVSR